MELRLLLITHMPSFMGLAETPADTCGRLRFGIAACLESVAELRVESIPRETQMIRHETHCVGAERLAEYGERERESGRLLTPATGLGAATDAR